MSRVRQNAFAYLERELKSAGITDISPSFGDVLAVLSEKQPVSMKELAETTRRDKSTITNTVKLLENNGYIKRMPAKNDKRVVLLTLTDRANDALQHVTSSTQKVQKQMFRGLGRREVEFLSDLLEKIEKNL